VYSATSEKSAVAMRRSPPGIASRWARSSELASASWRPAAML
jgi:hypothetical protein